MPSTTSTPVTHTLGAAATDRRWAVYRSMGLVLAVLAAALLGLVGCKGNSDGSPRTLLFHGLQTVSVEQRFDTTGGTSVPVRVGTDVAVRFEMRDEAHQPIDDLTMAMLTSSGIDAEEPVFTDGPAGRLRVLFLVDGSAEAYDDPQQMNAVADEIDEMMTALNTARPDGYRFGLYEFADVVTATPSPAAIDGPTGTNRSLYSAVEYLAEQAYLDVTGPTPECRSALIVLVTTGADVTTPGLSTDPLDEAIGAARQRGVGVHAIELGDGQALDGEGRRTFDVLPQIGRDGSYVRAATESAIPDAFELVTDRLRSTYVVTLPTNVISGEHSATLVAEREDRAGTSDPFTFDAGVAGDRPGAPTGLRTETVGTTMIALRWNASMEALAYELQARPGGAGSSAWQTIYDGANTFGTDSGLLAGTRYDYRVRAANQFGPSDWSAVLPAITVCDPPTGVDAVMTDFTSFRVMWNPTQGAAQYDVQYREAGGTWVNAGTVTTTQFEINGLSLATNYEFRVRATNAGGPSAWSGTAQGRTAEFPPVNLRQQDGTDISIRMRASTSVGSSSYIFRIATSPNGPWTNSSGGPTPFNLFVSLSPDRTYYVQVRGNNTPWSSTALAYTAPEAPANLRQNSAGPGRITMIWSIRAGADQYRLEVSSSPSGPWTTLYTGTSTVITFGGLPGNAIRYFRVRSIKNGNLISLPSRVVQGQAGPTP